MTPLRWIALLFCAAALVVLWPLWPPLILAAWTATLVRPLLERFDHFLKGRRRAAAVLSLMLFLLLVLPLVLVALGVITGAQDLVTTLQSSPTAASALERISSGAAPESALQVPRTLPEVLALLERSGTQGLGLLTNVAGAVGKGVIGLFIYFAGAYVFLVETPALAAWVKRTVPIDPGHLDRLGGAFNETGRGLLVGVGLTSLTQGVLATIIYLALGVPRALVLGPITGLSAIIPFVGTSLVWGPVSLGLFLTDRPVKAVILVVLGVGVISLADNLLRPIYARLGALRMPLFLVFISVFGGLAAFGTWGALMGPLVVRLAMEALALLKEASDAAEGPPAPAGEAGAPGDGPAAP